MENPYQAPSDVDSPSLGQTNTTERLWWRAFWWAAVVTPAAVALLLLVIHVVGRTFDWWQQSFILFLIAFFSVINLLCWYTVSALTVRTVSMVHPPKITLKMTNVHLAAALWGTTFAACIGLYITDGEPHRMDFDLGCALTLSVIPVVLSATLFCYRLRELLDTTG